jgi:hypothetical protein
MDLTPFGLAKRRDTVTIVGAGATRGASFVENADVVKPPMDGDFFQQLRLAQLASHSLREGRDLLSFVETEFGSLEVGMETFYSQAFLHDRFVGDIPTGSRGRLRRYEANLRRFRSLLPLVLGASLQGNRCSFHEALVHHSAATDVFISFNYDCVLDTALAGAGQRRWDPARGYGFAIGGDTAHWRDHAGRGRFPQQTIRLLKPHGSLNWQRSDAAFKLRSDPYTQRQGDDDLLIVPPLWQKEFDQEPYRTTWSEARKALRTSRSLLVLGYSLPETDVYTQAMLRIDVGHLDFLCIVNPDGRARQRIKAALRSSIDSATHLLELDTIRDAARLILRGHETEPPSTTSLV